MRFSFVLTFILIFTSPIAFAQGSGISRPFGLGLMLGGPTCLTANYYLSGSTSIDSCLAWGFSDYRGHQLYLRANYLKHWRGIFHLDNERFDGYLGFGARIFLIDDQDVPNDGEEDFEIGPRLPAGIAYRLRKFPVEILAEIGFVLDLIPDLDVDFDAGIGARYYF